jgi:hypothetical protein
MTEHSPLIWCGDSDGKYHCKLIAGDGEVVARNITPENAALIVRAVNSHERLVEGLRSIEEFCMASFRDKIGHKVTSCGYTATVGNDALDVSEILHLVHAALAQAEPKP